MVSDSSEDAEELEEPHFLEPKKPEPIDIHFEVPVSGGLHDLHMTSETAHVEVIFQIAETMGVRKVDMPRIGYIFSFTPKSPKPIPKFFDTPEAWNQLLCDAATYIATEKGKNRGKGQVRAWRIRIEELGSKGTASGDGKVCNCCIPSPHLFLT